jgi:SpoIID/LytB domain protein
MSLPTLPPGASTVLSSSTSLKRSSHWRPWMLFGLTVAFLLPSSLIACRAGSQSPSLLYEIGSPTKVAMLPSPVQTRLKPEKHATPKTEGQVTQNRNLIRVGLSDDDMKAQSYPATRIGATGPYQVSQDTGVLVASVSATTSMVVSATPQGLWLDAGNGTPKQGPYAGPLRFQTLDSQARLRVPSITRKGSVPSYRGQLEVVRAAGQSAQLSVINSLDLDDYLRAVVPNELPISFGAEAVRAQAIAARNYAVRPREKPWTQFDICDSQYCQAYYGAQTETPDTDALLKETEGLISLWQGSPILALYSSSHGGYSEDYSNAFSDVTTQAFPAPPIPYLAAKPDSPKDVATLKAPDLSLEEDARQFWTQRPAETFDRQSPLLRWEYQWTRSQMEGALGTRLAELSTDATTRLFVSPSYKKGQPFGKLLKLEPIKRGKSGKLMHLDVVSSKGKWRLSKEFVIRKAFPLPTNAKRNLPSANVVFSHLTDPKGEILSVVAQGGGFGHGVGMSQYGASQMGRLGFRYPQILRHYYPNTRLGTLPIKVGPQPVQTHFRVPATATQANLHGLFPCPATEKELTLELNEAPYRLQAESSSVSLNSPLHVQVPSVQDSLKRNEPNTLRVLSKTSGSSWLFPSQQTAESTCSPKVWLEFDGL